MYRHASVLGLGLLAIITILPASSQAHRQLPTAGKTGIALTIGLNQVDRTHYPLPDLTVAENDARDIAKIAAARGFAVTTLLTKDATRKRVFDEIRSAAAALNTGDIFLLSFAGHGGFVADANGDETDRLDETWCLYDGQAIDDELADLWTKFKSGVRILVISDSCHSGTVSKFRDYSQYMRISQPKFVDVESLGQRFETRLSQPAGPLPSPLRGMLDTEAESIYKKNKEFYDKIGNSAPKEKESERSTRATVLLISACQDNQLAYEGTSNGLFTAGLKDVWRGGAFIGDYRDFHRAIVSLMPAYQTPNYYLTGPPNPAFEAETPFTR